MPEPENPTPAIKFPVRPAAGAAPSLSLRRRSVSGTRGPFAISEASAAARESIKALVSATRAPFGPGAQADVSHVAELEKSLRQLELTLAERERLVEENEARLNDRERDLAEMEALLMAREKLAAAS